MHLRSTTLTSSFVRSLIPARRKETYKKHYGNILVLAGSRGMTGAAMLCAHGALRAGAGLVTIGAPASQQQVVAAHARPEAMTLPLPETAAGMLSIRAFPRIAGYVRDRRITALVLGPGLGLSRDVAQLVRKILASFEVPVVLDADGISVLAGEAGGNDLRVKTLASARAGIVVTPHLGEISRLVKCAPEDIAGTRLEVAQRFSRENGVVCVLKGYHTVIASEGHAFINPTGNPGMATGGSGDVLAGVIGALIAQVAEPRLLHAALAGVYLHGLAGDLAALDKTQAGFLPGDIAEYLPAAMKKIGMK